LPVLFYCQCHTVIYGEACIANSTGSGMVWMLVGLFAAHPEHRVTIVRLAWCKTILDEREIECDRLPADHDHMDKIGVHFTLAGDEGASPQRDEKVSYFQSSGRS